MKTCSICKKEKEYSEFCKNKSSKDGYHYSCKECHNRENSKWKKDNPGKEREYYYKNREKRILYSKEWAHNNPEKRKISREKWIRNNPELAKEAARKSYYKPENHKRKMEYNKKWVLANPDKTRKGHRDYMKRNKEKRIMLQNRRKARQRETAISKVNYNKILERDNWTCQYCGVKTSKDLPLKDNNYTTFDHVIPLCRGGTETEHNIVVACYKCNCIVKRNKLVEEMPEGFRAPDMDYFYEWDLVKI